MYKVCEMNIMLDGAKVRRLRKEHGLTQTVLAEMVMRSERHISDLERGACGNTTLITAVRLSIALGVKVDDLILITYKKAE